MKLNLKTLSTLLIATTMGITVAQANQDSLSLSAEDLAHLALPEHVDLNEGKNLQNKSSAGNIKMECYVDTPAWDVFRSPRCGSAGSAYTTTAVFRVSNVPSYAHVIWSNAGCPAYLPNLCFQSITQNQGITGVATVVNSNTGQVITAVSATAHYFGNF